MKYIELCFMAFEPSIERPIQAASAGAGSRRDLGMPVQGTPVSGTLWAAGGRVLMQSRVAGAGEGRFRRAAHGGNFPRFHGGISCRKGLDVPVMLSVFHTFGHELPFFDDRVMAATQQIRSFPTCNQYFQE